MLLKFKGGLPSGFSVISAAENHFTSQLGRTT